MNKRFYLIRFLSTAVLSFILVFGISLMVSSSLALYAQKGSDQNPLTAEAFIESRAGQAMQSGQYEEALAAINDLIDKTPNDPLLIRYRAIALDRLGRTQEAVEIFEDLLLDTPDHVPTRFFLAQAYQRLGRRDLAVEEWKKVASLGEATPYAAWAHTSLTRTGDVQRHQAQGRGRNLRRWNVYGLYGYEYDSNVILRPNDESLASSSDQNSGRQVMNLAVRYRAYSQRDIALDLLYTVRQTIHDDSLNEFNFHSEEVGVNIRKKLQVNGQEVVAGLRYDVMVGFLHTDLFSVRNRWTASADVRLTPKSRTVFYDRITVANYGPDGSNRSLTGRDGLYNDAGFTHYIFSDDFRKHIYITEEFISSHTEGDNFDTIGSNTRVGFHTPLSSRFDFDSSMGLRMRFYPSYSSISTRDTSRRRDMNWDLYSAVTYHVTPRVGLRGFYRYISGDNQNNFFDYNRHIGGAQVIYSQSF